MPCASGARFRGVITVEKNEVEKEVELEEAALILLITPVVDTAYTNKIACDTTKHKLTVVAAFRLQERSNKAR